MSDRDAAFEAYFAARSDAMRSTAYLLCGDWHRAEDLVQLTFTKIYLAWRRIQRHEAMDSYTRQTLIRTFLSERRRGCVPARVGRLSGHRSGGTVVRAGRRTGRVAGGTREGAAAATRRTRPAVLGGRVRRADRRATRMLGRKCEEPGSPWAGHAAGSARRGEGSMNEEDRVGRGRRRTADGRRRGRSLADRELRQSPIDGPGGVERPQYKGESAGLHRCADDDAQDQRPLAGRPDRPYGDHRSARCSGRDTDGRPELVGTSGVQYAEPHVPGRARDEMAAGAICVQ